jgi:hypothetical protein
VKAVLGGIAVPSVGAMPALPDNSTIFHVPLLWNHAMGDLFAEATDHSLFASQEIFLLMVTMPPCSSAPGKMSEVEVLEERHPRDAQRDKLK